MKRRTAISTLTGLAALSISPISFSFPLDAIRKRRIGSTGELLPCVGVGTWQTFDVGPNEHQRQPLREVLSMLVKQGATVVDSSPMYGSSEEVVGDLSTDLKINDKLFVATKVWTSGKQAGIQQMENSLKLLKREKIDLMQVHNLVDWKTHIKTLEQWKAEGKIRYIGLTHYTDSMHDTLREIIRTSPIDFIQINYSVNSRNAEKTLLPTALDKGVGVLVNRPFDEGALFRQVKGKPVPEYAKEFDCLTWGSFFLKFILANPAVTCVIPGTSNPKHLADNLSAGFGKLPTANQLKRMIGEVQ
jgi:diketogulonate reductase-like aldo/keto reductase